MHAVFISYSSEDKAVAFDACRALESAGLTCWIAPRDVMAGRPYSGQIIEAIRRAQAFVLVLSRKSDESRQVLREIERAAHSRLHLIAFRIEDFEPSDDLAYFLSVEHWLNAFEGVSPETHFPELLQHTSALLREGVSDIQEVQTKPGPGAEPAGTERFANYHIIKRPDGALFRLGPGAMGVTYKAFDTSLDRHVALKVIAADLLGSDEARRRFLREARAAAKIQHPNVAAIYHLGQEGNDYFYTMELVDGEDMERYVEARGPLSPPAALQVVLQVAEALEAAQVHNLIHRDIKPANIMARVNRTGNLDVKLIDFGLAKGAGPGTQDLSRVTHTMSFVGSPAYASPEQCEMGDLDTRSDIYSLGATLWFLLIGKPPFVGNVNQVLIAHAMKPPPFEQLQGIPDLVVELLRRMLAKNPDKRPRSPQELQEEIERTAANLAADFGEIPVRTAAQSKNPLATGVDVRSLDSGGSATVLSPSLDAYLRIDVGILLAERYRLEEEQREGNGGRLFMAHDEKATTRQAARVALKLLHPEIASDAALLGLLESEIDVVNGAPNPHLCGNFILERGTPCFVREWLHGFLLYDLLRMRRSCSPQEVVTLLESLAATLDFVSEKGLGLVDVSIRKLFLCCPADVRPDQFESLALGDFKTWARCTLKLNPISLAPLLFRERPAWSSQTLVPSSRVLSMTQAEAGIRGNKAVRLLGCLVYELISGHAPALRANERPSPLPLLNESGNQALWKTFGSIGEAMPYLNCEEFWSVFKESVSERIPRAASHTAKSESKKPSAKIPKAVHPPPPKPEKPPPSSSGRSGERRPSKQVIAVLAIATAMAIGGVFYLANRPSRPLPTQPAPIVASIPSPTAVESKSLPTQPAPIVASTPSPTAVESKSLPTQPAPIVASTPSPTAVEWKPANGVVGAGVIVRFAGDSDVGEGGRWTRATAEEWAQKTGNRMEYISRPFDASATLQLFQQYWAAESADIDVFMVDCLWQGLAAPHAVDLKKYYSVDEIKAFFPRIIQNNTVGGKLVSIPWFTDTGLLYYRTDLLEKYGYKDAPKTWEELAEMAKKIQDGEREKGKLDFQGFVFQGKASESLTCDAIEWIDSYGGGGIVEPNKRVTINNPKAIEALQIAKRWVGTISPLGVTTYGEEDVRNIWQAGNAAFMRNWPYAYALGQDRMSPIAGKFDVSVLPKGGTDGKNTGCLGGWQLMVSSYSKVPNAAADLVRYLCSTEAQKRRSIQLSYLPTQPALYFDADVLARNPHFKNILPALENAVARPSTVTGADYNTLSIAFFQNVNKVLTGQTTAKDAVIQVEKVARRILR